MKRTQNLVKEACRIVELLKEYDSCRLEPRAILCIKEEHDDSNGDYFEKRIEEYYVGQDENPFYFEPYDREEKRQIAIFSLAISNYVVSWNPEKEEPVVIKASGKSFEYELDGNSYVAMMTEAFRIKDELAGSKDDGERRKVTEVKLTKNRVKPVSEYEWDDSDNSRSYWDYLERSRQYGDDFLPPPPSYNLEERVAIADMVVALCDCDSECDSKITYKTWNDVVTMRLGSDEAEGYGSYY